ncbi:MAG TPA: hypothetical protein VK703_14955 [Candidatus Acidoferrales bacterium]|nr:hypothetical protein [Candidatus Acidoferrales bacterium]
MPEEITPPTVADAAPVVAEEKPAAPKLKTRKPKQRACDEKDAKGKLCNGHLKRWFDYSLEVANLVGKGSEVYRCEFCKTVYRPDPKQQPNSFTVRY